MHKKSINRIEIYEQIPKKENGNCHSLQSDLQGELSVQLVSYGFIRITDSMLYILTYIISYRITSLKT